MSTPWHADAGEIGKFVRALFAYAESDTFIALRAFDQGNTSLPARMIRPIRINGSIDAVIREAVIAAEDASQYNDPVVFCPPIATFSNADRARTIDLANGLTLSVELDDSDPDTARARLEGILGPVTVLVRSGSDWIDASTGEVKPRIHLHWRLTEPTTTIEDHGRLNQARTLAAMLVGADMTGKPVVHPLRWPGSWNLKATPRMATIAVLNETAEINLSDALEGLELAAETMGSRQRDDMPGVSSTPEAKLSDIRSAMAVIPNLGIEVHYDWWIKFGYAVHRATGGGEVGFQIWDNWSRLSDKYNAAQTEAAWRRIAGAMAGPAPSVTVGAGTIFFWAKANGWVRPFPFGSTGSGHDSAHDTPGNADETAKDPRPRILTMRQLDALPPPEWLVAGLIPEKSLVVPFGPPKSGKTFIVLSWCLHVAAGKEWFGHAVKQGAVVYIAGEGTGGLSLRLRAMRQAYGIDIDASLWIIPRAVNFRLETEVDNLVTLIRATVGAVPVQLVVIDTLSRAMPGADENSAQEVGLVIAGCDRVRDILGCSTVPIHHSGKDAAKGARGTSALRGAWDTALEIVAMGKRTIMTVVDQKEAEAGQRLVFRMDKVMVGMARSSLVPMLDMGAEPEEERARVDPAGQAGIALSILRNLMASPESAILPPFAGVPSGDVRGVSHEIWRRGFYEKMPGEPQEKRKLAFWRASQKLQHSGFVGVRDPWVWLV